MLSNALYIQTYTFAIKHIAKLIGRNFSISSTMHDAVFLCQGFFFIIQPHFVSIDNRYYFTHADEWWYVDGLINVVSNKKITKLGICVFAT